MSRTRKEIFCFASGCPENSVVASDFTRETRYGNSDIADAATLINQRFDKIRYDRIKLMEIAQLLAGDTDPSTDHSLGNGNASLYNFMTTLSDPECRLLVPSFESSKTTIQKLPNQLDEDRALVGMTLFRPDAAPRIIILNGLGLRRTLLIAALCVADGIIRHWQNHNHQIIRDNSAVRIAKSIFGSTSKQALPNLFTLSAPRNRELVLDGHTYICSTRTAVELRLLTYFVT